jgi:hypothetical protein
VDGRHVHGIRVVMDIVCILARLLGGPSDDFSSCTCLGSVMGLRVCNMLVMALSARMFVFLAWMDESFVTDEQVTSGEGLATEITNKWLLLGMCANVALEMFLCRGQCTDLVIDEQVVELERQA